MTKCAVCERDNRVGDTVCAGCGAPLSPGASTPSAASSDAASADTPAADSPPADPPALAHELREYLAAGNLIDAVKHYRETTGKSLTESKITVETLRDSGSFPAPRDPTLPRISPAHEAAILELLRNGKSAEALQLYREQTGLGLKASRTGLQAIARQHHINLQLRGCGSVVALGVVMLLAIVFVYLLLFRR